MKYFYKKEINSSLILQNDCYCMRQLLGKYMQTNTYVRTSVFFYILFFFV